MNYIQELTNQLSLLSKNEKMKINIHFIISEPLNSFCIDLNQKVQRCNSGLIRMGTNSIVLPHVSIFMGFVDSYQMLDSVFSIIDEYAKSQTSFSLDPTKMYFKNVSKYEPKYLFIDLLQYNYLMKQKQILNSLLKDKVFPIGWDMTNEPPHITIGCYRKVTEQAQSIIDETPIIPSCTISQIGISVSGKKGVCLGSLKVFPLKQTTEK